MTENIFMLHNINKFKIIYIIWFMKTLGIIIDSFSGITQKEAQKQGFYFLPLQIEINGKVYEDGIDSTENLLEKLLTANTFLTSLPRLDRIETSITEASEKFDEVIYLGINENLSSASRYAKTIAQNFKNVHIFDNHLVGSQITKVANFALEHFKKHQNIDQLLSEMNQINQESLTFLVPTNLNYMIKGGRLTGVKKFIMTKIAMIPVLEYKENGTVSPVALKRTFAGALQKITEKLVKIKDSFDISLICGIDQKNNDTVNKIVQENDIKLDTVQKTPMTIAIHTGPEAVALIAMPKLALK
ncbi:fatty acid-binding protein DegV-like protein [Mycoplasmopsis gallinacea]|uniref:Fatty acid-binding protein DegV-like protein n=2 Tax=Mycoplasmopsis gallinacea TaxID=29556 RepID=A0A449A2A9_9BACT|nr:fatty acid-binding protein DegV-like protein [Mycoplasmopsis gallinacea]